MSGDTADGQNNATLVYFYCDRNRTYHRDPLAVLRSLVRQLSAPNGDSSIISYIEDKYLERKKMGFSKGPLTSEECEDLLLRLSQDYSRVDVILDGLDECDKDTRHLLMDVLDLVVEKTKQPVKIFIASRQDQDLKDRYKSRGYLEITAKDNQDDIEKFLLSKLEQSTFCRTKMSTQAREEILKVFQTKSQGMQAYPPLPT